MKAQTYRRIATATTALMLLSTAARSTPPRETPEWMMEAPPLRIPCGAQNSEHLSASPYLQAGTICGNLFTATEIQSTKVHLGWPDNVGYPEDYTLATAIIVSVDGQDIEFDRTDGSRTIELGNTSSLSRPGIHWLEISIEWTGSQCTNFVEESNDAGCMGRNNRDYGDTESYGRCTSYGQTRTSGTRKWAVFVASDYLTLTDEALSALPDSTPTLAGTVNRNQIQVGSSTSLTNLVIDTNQNTVLAALSVTTDVRDSFSQALAYDSFASTADITWWNGNSMQEVTYSGRVSDVLIDAENRVYVIDEATGYLMSATSPEYRFDPLSDYSGFDHLAGGEDGLALAYTSQRIEIELFEFGNLVTATHLSQPYSQDAFAGFLPFRLGDSIGLAVYDQNACLVWSLQSESGSGCWPEWDRATQEMETSYTPLPRSQPCVTHGWMVDTQGDLIFAGPLPDLNDYESLPWPLALETSQSVSCDAFGNLLFVDIQTGEVLVSPFAIFAE